MKQCSNKVKKNIYKATFSKSAFRIIKQSRDINVHLLGNRIITAEMNQIKWASMDSNLSKSNEILALSYGDNV